jgi:hypothetical protein
MKKLVKNMLKCRLSVYFFCFLVVLSIEANAQQNIKSSHPKIVFEQTSYDYGAIFAGDNGEITFNFKNEGKSPLIISNVVSSCGCVVPFWSKDPLMPSQNGTIKIKYNTNIVGDIKRSITVSTNDPNQSRVVLILTGKVVKNNK